MLTNSNSLIYTAFIIFTLLTYILAWDYHSEGTDWVNSCRQGPQAPIDISEPFLYKDINISFFYSNMLTEYSLYQDGNNLQVDGDFGYIKYANTIYVSSNLIIFSPSQHTFKTNRFPLELQIVHQDSEGNKVTICIMFKESKIEYSVLLGKLFFDELELQTLPINDKRILKEPINFSKYISDDKDFFIYESNEPMPPCTKHNTFFVLTDLLNVNVNQINNFPLMIKNQRRVMQLRLGRVIYITIPQENIAEKIAADRKIRDENEMREIKNQELTKLGEQQAEKEKAKAVVVVPITANSTNVTNTTNVTTTIKANTTTTIANNTTKPNEFEAQSKLEVSIPFESIKQRIIAQEKSSKKVDLKVITSALMKPNVNQRNHMIIDKEIPRTEGEIQRDELRHKYLIWRSIYKDFIEGKMISLNFNTNPSLIQMKEIEQELKDNNYSPYITDVIEMNNNNDVFGNSFVQYNQPMQTNNKKQKRYPSLFIQLSKPNEDKDKADINNLEVDLKGRRALNEPNRDILDSAGWSRECNNPQYKSPIQINGNYTNEQHPLQLNLREPNGNLILNNDGLKIIVSVSNGDFGSITYGDHKYITQKLYIHVPSIHTLGEKDERSAMEMQILSSDEYGNWASIAVLFEVGNKSNPFLKAIGFDTDMNPIYTSQLRNSQKVEIQYNKAFKDELNLSQFIDFNGDKLKYVSYIGSTPTPPCKSNVKWFVMLTKQFVSQTQLDHFPILFGRRSNIRGLQPINKRNIRINKE